MRFTKMHGAGNDYIYINAMEEGLPDDLGELAIRMSHRRFGVGADGLILIVTSDNADAGMRMFNADGSESEMCGNGIRCVAKYVYDHGIARKRDLKIETGAGVLSLHLELDHRDKVDQVTVDMGSPKLLAREIPTTLGTADQMVVHRQLDVLGHSLHATCVSMGNPHCVIFVPEITDELVLKVGPIIELDERFPKRTNVEFVEVLARGEVRQRTWERGSGETWACGTGASAVCVAGVLTGNTDRSIINHLLGGDLKLVWDETSNHVFMTGPAREVFEGNWPT
ncbi:MAG: diaminopimelate epimerase [Pirellulaceae bacterium]|jgi:diaminopimelate epimerase